MDKLKLQLTNSESEKAELKKNYDQLSELLKQTEIVIILLMSEEKINFLCL